MSFSDSRPSTRPNSSRTLSAQNVYVGPPLAKHYRKEAEEWSAAAQKFVTRANPLPIGGHCGLADRANREGYGDPSTPLSLERKLHSAPQDERLRTAGTTTIEVRIMIRVGLIGYGYWGRNLARNFNAHPGFDLVRIADISDDHCAQAKEMYPHTEVVNNPGITEDPDLDAIVVSTPVFTHYELARKALLNGKHVWVEKPMTSTSEQAKELIDLADARDLILMVDHTFLFTGPVQSMKTLIDDGELGDLYYYDSVRVNLGIFQHDINVIWDLAPHDFSIMDYLLGPTARSVSAHGRDHFSTGLEDVAYVSVFYENNLMAHFHLNWLSPVKIRRTVVGGSRRMLMWDDLNQEEKLKVYDKGMEVTTREGMYRVLATPRFGVMHAPVVPNTEALKSEVGYFHECIENGERPHNDGVAGLRVVKMLEATDRSLREDGKVIELEETCLIP